MYQCSLALRRSSFFSRPNLRKNRGDSYLVASNLLIPLLKTYLPSKSHCDPDGTERSPVITATRDVSNEVFLKKAITIYINTRSQLTVNKENDVPIDETVAFKRLLDVNVYITLLNTQSIKWRRNFKRVFYGLDLVVSSSIGRISYNRVYYLALYLQHDSRRTIIKIGSNESVRRIHERYA